jgi:Flp pilus assembly pilin Flp
MKKRSILRNESGQGLTEYLVLLILISIASITIVTQMGNAVEGRFRAAKEKINSMSVNGNDDGGK